jgi:hypothetical protein
VSEQQEVVTKIRIDYDGEKAQRGLRDSAKAAGEFAGQVDKTNRSLEDLQRREERYRGRGTMPGGMPGTSAVPYSRLDREAGGQGPAGALGMSAAMTGIGTAVAAAAATAKAMEVAANSFNVLHNASLSGAQKANALEAAIPVVGTLSKLSIDVRDAYFGRAERLREMQDRSQIVDAFQDAQHQAHLQREPVRDEMARARDRARALAGISPILPGSFDRNTLAGQQGYQQDLATLAERNALQRSQALAGVGRENYGKIGKDISLLEAERWQLERRAAKEQQTADYWKGKEDRGEGRFKVERLEAERARQETLNEIARKGEEIVERTNERKKVGLELVQQEAAARQASVALGVKELAVLEAREQRTAINARRLGSQNPIDRQAGLRAAQFIKQHGLGRATPDLVAAAGRFAPDWLGKQQEQFGEQSAEYKQGQREGFFGLDVMSLRQIRQQLNESQSNVQVNVVLDAAAVGKATAAELEKFGKNFIHEVDRKITTIFQRLQQEQRLGHAAGN